MKRREFLWVATAAPLALSAAGRTLAATQPGKAIAEIQANWKALLPAGANLDLSTAPIEKSPAEWKKLLGDSAYSVLREEGTERPFSSPLNAEKRRGLFVCAGCALPLFTSEMKYDSGTGWPSFFTSISDHLASKSDYKLFVPRTEYHCVRCGGHQGHIFDDGPPPTRQRWCNNGLALRFLAAQGKA